MPRDYVIEDGVMWHNTSLIRHKRNKNCTTCLQTHI